MSVFRVWAKLASRSHTPEAGPRGGGWAVGQGTEAWGEGRTSCSGFSLEFE